MTPVALLAAALTLAACSSSSTTCRLPSSVQTDPDMPELGCFAATSASCAPAEYFYHCAGPTMPDPSLHCRALALPGPAAYCCPCAPR